MSNMTFAQEAILGKIKEKANRNVRFQDYSEHEDYSDYGDYGDSSSDWT